MAGPSTDGQFAHNVAAVDAQRALDENLDHETPLSELFEDQIACADMIVVNKTDLLDAAEADALAAKLKSEARDGVQVIRASMGALPVDVLLGPRDRGRGRPGRRATKSTTIITMMMTKTTTIMNTSMAMTISKASSSPAARSPTPRPLPHRSPMSSARMTFCASRASWPSPASPCA